MLFFDSFEIQLNKKRILDRMECYENSEGYDRFKEEYDKVEKIALEKIKPKAVLAVDRISKDFYHSKKNHQKGVYVLFTIGEEISTYIDELFAGDNYVQGLLVDIIADDYIYQMDEKLQEEVKNLCKEYHMHTVRRIEAPTDIPLEINKDAYKICKGENLLHIKIKDSFMYEPVKTLCVIYELDDGEGDCVLNHSCVKCEKLSCKQRKFDSIKITVHSEKEIKSYVYQGGESLLSFLRKQNIHISANCGGIGICGKCKIRCLEGELEIGKTDSTFFSKKELDEGFRLACMAYPKQDLTIEVYETFDKMHVVTTNCEANGNAESDIADLTHEDLETYGIAIDIGTTTLAMALVSRGRLVVEKQYAGINHQRIFGLDVISRIQAANDGKNYELQQIIKKDIWEGILTITNNFEKKIDQIVISGNTTMIHLLMNYSCEKLGVFPYESDYLSAIYTNVEKLFGKEIEIEVIIMPGISAFIGGDIVSGLYALDFIEKKDASLLIDLGTNGELVVGNKEYLICTSTAIGPAFEGGKITSGVPSIAGAIDQIQKNIISGDLVIHTIFDQEPIGICGSGLIDIIAILLNEHTIDESGLLNDTYFDNGFQIYENTTGDTSKSKVDIRITQKDIREIQLAKAAVSAGVETIVEEYGEEKIQAVYLAGGFGTGINIHNAKTVGLVPKGGHTEIVGNTSLQGGIKFLWNDIDKQEVEMKRIEELIRNTKKINLSESTLFQEKYIENMYFKI